MTRIIRYTPLLAAIVASIVLMSTGCGSGSSSPEEGGTGGSGTGGATGSGGAPSQAGTGGAVAGTGGAMSGTGGRGTGGSGAGGRTGTGGAIGPRGTGGASGGGTGGSAVGGTGGAGGASPSAGCGITDWLKSGRASIDVSGTTREYILKIPDNYDTNHAYKLIFGWHWRGGVANDVATGNIIGGPYYGLQSRSAGSAIFVAPEGLDMGWANTNDRDITFLKAMLALFESKLCIDQQRIFSTGFSYGGMMSDTIGCEMADVFRAIAPMSDALYSGCREPNTHPIAVWMAHGDNDTTVPLADGMAALNKFLSRNQCGTQTAPVTPSPCVQYQGCATGYPVTWCLFSGGHMPWSPSSDAVWTFFNQF
jgi:hypothetical protein